MATVYSDDGKYYTSGGRRYEASSGREVDANGSFVNLTASEQNAADVQFSLDNTDPSYFYEKENADFNVGRAIRDGSLQLNINIPENFDNLNNNAVCTPRYTNQMENIKTPPTNSNLINDNESQDLRIILVHSSDTSYTLSDTPIFLNESIPDNNNNETIERENEEGSSNRKLTDDEFDDMMSSINYWIDEGFIHVGCDAAWNPPTRDKDYKVNSRICGNVFYDGTKLPVDKIDWTGLKIAEDYYVTLQLLTMGYQNKISLKYRVDPHETQSKGGCSTFRSLDLHNDSMKQLQQKFPSFVKLKEKVAKNSGEWSNKVKLAAVIQWKKAYQSSQVNTLDAFMT